MESLVYLTKGSKVEITSNEKGFRGSYCTATIIDTPQHSPWPTNDQHNNTYVIQYDNYTTEDGQPLIELAHVSCIRPLPPLQERKQHSSSFHLNDVVEAFYKDGWWVGVVDKVKLTGTAGGGEMKWYSVRFEDPLHFMGFYENELRPHFNWVHGKWVSYESSKKVVSWVLDSKETTPVSFKSPSVSNRTRKGLLEKSLPSEKISLNVILPSKTQQETVTPKHCSKKMKKEEGEGTPSHVSKDKSKAEPYALEKEGSTVTPKYCLKKTKKEEGEGTPSHVSKDKSKAKPYALEKEGSTVAPKYCSKKMKKEEGEGMSSRVLKDKSKTKPPYALEKEGSTLSESKKAKKSLEETSPASKYMDVIFGSLSAMEKRADEREHIRKNMLERSGLSVEKKSVDMVSPSKKRQLEILTPRHCSKKFKVVECGGASVSASKDKSNTRPYALENEGSTFSNTENTVEQTVDVSLPPTSNSQHSGQVRNADRGTDEDEINGEITFDHTVDVFSECTSIIPNSGQVRNGDGGSNGNEIVPTFASTEEGLELESITSTKATNEAQNLPFVKNSVIWEILESSALYKKMPQKPHFRPLYEKHELLREGLALARVITFTNIVDIIYKLRFDDPRSKFDDILEVLPEFDEHGFDTEPLKNHLDKLLSARTDVAELEVEAKETESQLMEKSRDKIRIKEKSDVVAKELDEIVKKLKDLEEQKVKLESMKVNNASEIVKLTWLMKNSVSI
ncbi:hypothetical protein ACFE04_030197 [Oxalis oulophora]